MKLFIVGCRGQLGYDIMQLAAQRGIDAAGVDLPECDIADPRLLQNNIRKAENSDVIVNAAAYTAVDRAESESAAAFAVNRDGPGHLAGLCREKHIPLIHISTDYVFDGTGRRPYAPDTPVSPLGVYGRSKAEGETAVRTALDRHVIVRTSWLYGVYGPNFVKTMLRLGKERDEIRVVDDQLGSPTHAGDLAAALLDIAVQITQGNAGWGTYHFCNQGSVSWYGFTKRIFELAAPLDHFRVRRIIPITSDHYPTPARRPQYSVLDCSSLENQFGIRRRDFGEALEEMLKILYSRKTSTVV